MISLSTNEAGNLKVTQCDISPTVYLDHWALLAVSEDEELSERLTLALESRGGTLALSWANAAEFAKVTDMEQTLAVENLIEANLPRLFFLEPNPLIVIDRENQLLAGGPSAPPHADTDFLRVFVTLRPASPKPFTAQGLFQWVRDQGLVQRLDELQDEFVCRIEAFRGKHETDPAFRSTLGRPARGPQIERATRLILRQVVRSLIADRKKKVNRHDAMDFFHAVVPVAYCDLVLLDKYWETQVGRIRSRLDSAGMTMPMAKVLSKKIEGINRFFGELESG